MQLKPPPQRRAAVAIAAVAEMTLAAAGY